MYASANTDASENNMMNKNVQLKYICPILGQCSIYIIFIFGPLLDPFPYAHSVPWCPIFHRFARADSRSV